MNNIFKRLGAQIILIAVAALAVTVAVVLVFSMTMVGNYNYSILIERANVGMRVLEDEVRAKTEEVDSVYTNWSDQSSFISAMTFRDSTYFEGLWKSLSSPESYFCAIGDVKGNVIYQSSTYPFQSINLSEVAKGNVKYQGLVLIDDTLAAVHAEQVSANGVVSALVVGYSMSSTDWLDSLKNMIDCDVTIFKGNTRYATTITDPSNNSRLVGTTMSSDVEKTVLNQRNAYQGKATIVGKPYYVSYEPMYDNSNNVVGAYFAGSDSSDADAKLSMFILISVIIGIAAILITGVLILIFTRKKVVAPIKQVTLIANELESGKMSTTDVVYKFGDDEIGTFANKLRNSKQELSGCITDISRILEKMAGGDFTAYPESSYPGEFESIRENILRIEKELGITLGKMSESSDEVLSGSDQMAEGSQSLADGTTKQAAAIEEISDTISEVSAKVAATAQNAARAGEISKQTEEEVNRQDSSITNMVGAMSEISSTSKEIEKIIKTIEDISFQTNILALNAAVEAARAGDAGKGFAVVADEVRNLANKSAEAAKSTTSLIMASISAVDKGSKIAAETAESMKLVKQRTAETAELIVMIADASREQTDSINQINNGIEQISQVVQMNSATAEETAASCQELSGQSRMLKDQVARFRINQ